MVVSLEIYSRGTIGSGTYASHYIPGATVTIENSLFEGDTLTIKAAGDALDTDIHKVRPVRLKEGSTKVFDGLIMAPGYDAYPNNTKSLTIKASGWESELALIDLSVIYPTGLNYINRSIDYMLTDLIQIANDMGIAKKAEYTYDTSKFQTGEYDTSIFTTTFTKSFTGSVWDAITELIQNVEILDTNGLWDWTPKIDALQHDEKIYLIPQKVRTYDISATATFKNFKLTTPKSIIKDYSRLQNFVTVIGKDNILTNHLHDITQYLISTITTTAGDTTVTGIGTNFNPDIATGDFIKKTSDLESAWTEVASVTDDLNLTLVTGGYNGTTGNETWMRMKPIVKSTEITSNDQAEFARGGAVGENQLADLNYLRISITNPSSSIASSGTIKITGSQTVAAPETDLVEQFYASVPANTTAVFYSDNLYRVLSSADDFDKAFRLQGFNGLLGLTFKVEEIMYGVAGKSINMFGGRTGPPIFNESFDTQTKADMYSQRLARLYHAPLIRISAKLKPEYVTTSNLTGKRVDFYNDFSGTVDAFVCLKQTTVYTGPVKNQSLEALLYNTDWEYME